MLRAYEEVDGVQSSEDFVVIPIELVLNNFRRSQAFTFLPLKFWKSWQILATVS